MSERRRLGVLGWPVAHSRSPAIQNAALAAAGLHDWRYQLLPVAARAVRRDRPGARPAPGFAGANVTIPHKQAALALAARGEPPGARAIGAANTLTFGAGGRDRRRQHRRAGAHRGAPVRRRRPHRDGPRRRRQRAGGRLGAARCRRRRGAALEPHRASAPASWRPSSAPRRPSGRRPPTCWSTAPRSASTARDPFDRLPLAPGDLTGYGCVVDLVYTRGGTVLVDRGTRAGDRGGRRPRAAHRPGRAQLRAVHRRAGLARGDARGRSGSATANLRRHGDRGVHPRGPDLQPVPRHRPAHLRPGRRAPRGRLPVV